MSVNSLLLFIRCLLSQNLDGLSLQILITLFLHVFIVAGSSLWQVEKRGTELIIFAYDSARVTNPSLERKCDSLITFFHIFILKRAIHNL